MGREPCSASSHAEQTNQPEKWKSVENNQNGENKDLEEGVIATTDIPQNSGSSDQSIRQTQETVTARFEIKRGATSPETTPELIKAFQEGAGITEREYCLAFNTVMIPGIGKPYDA